MKELFLIILVGFLTVMGQVCLKLGLTENGGLWTSELGVWKNLLTLFSIKLVWIGFFIYFIATILFMHIIYKLEISYYYPWTSLTYIFAFLAGIFIFNEPFLLKRAIGTVIIIIGVIFVSL